MSVPALRIPISAKMDDFERDMNKTRETSVRLLRGVAQQVIKFNQDLSAGAAQTAASWEASWLKAGARVAAGVGLGIGAAILSAKAIGAVIDSVREQLADVIALGDRAAAAGVSGEFFQSFIAGARNAKISVDVLEDALRHANEQTKGRLAPDWNVWDEGKRKITEVEKALTDFRELFTTDQKFTGLDLFRDAGDTENRSRAVLIAMQELEAIGQRLASLDLAEKMFGAKFADNVRQGNTSANELLGTIDKLAQDKTGVWSSKLIEDAREIDRQLKQANDRVEREMTPTWQGLVDKANTLKGAWASIVDLIGQAIGVMNRMGGPLSISAGVVSGARVVTDGTANGLGVAAGLNDIGKGSGVSAIASAAGTVDIGPRDRHGNIPLPQRRPSDAPKPEKEKETEEMQTAFENATDAINRNIAALQADAAAVGLTQGAHQQLRVELRLIEAARQSGVEITDEQIARYTQLRASMSAEQALAAAGITLEKDQAEQFGKLSERIRMVADSLDAKRRSFQGVNDAVRFAGNELVNVIDRASEKGAKFGDIMSDVLRNVSRQLLQAALTGEGAFAKMFGMSSNTGGVGGLGGLIAGLFKGGSSAAGGATNMVGIAGDLAVPTFMAEGGRADAGELIYAGEHGPNPKLFRAPEPMIITPNDVRPASGGGGGMSVSVSVGDIDARGAQLGVGDEITARMRREVPGIVMQTILSAQRYGKLPR